MSFWDKVRLTTGPDRNVNNLKQPVNNVSEMESPNDFRQTEMVTDIPIEQTITDYDQMIYNIAPQYDTTPENLEDIMNRIAFHETGGTMSPSTQQIGGGPGRGLFQFESGPKGSKTGAGATAMGYLRQYYREVLGQEPPAWTEYDVSKGLDASKLSEDQQRMMFLANTLMAGGRSFEGITPENLTDWWLDEHWAGGANNPDRPGRRAKFDEDMIAYDLKYAPTAEELSFP